jgi:hypothetical protein
MKRLTCKFISITLSKHLLSSYSKTLGFGKHFLVHGTKLLYYAGGGEKRTSSLFHGIK